MAKSFSLRRLSSSCVCAAAAALAATLGLMPAVASAQKFPDRPIKLVIPFPTGGGTDMLGRKISVKLGEALGQPVIVENRGGAGGSIGSEAVAKAPADGYTLLFVPNSLSINAALYKNLPFDALKSFTPVGLVAVAPQVLVTSIDSPITSVRALLAQAKAKPASLNWSSAGNGSPGHVATALFNKLAGVDIAHVQYKGGGPAVNDLLAGHTQIGIQTFAVVSPFITAGRLRALGVATGQRSQLLPDVPTIAEAGVPGYSAELWYGLFVPVGTPEATVVAINAALNKTLADPELRRVLSAQGFESRPGSAADFRTFFVQDVANTARIVMDANIKAE